MLYPAPVHLEAMNQEPSSYTPSHCSVGERSVTNPVWIGNVMIHARPLDYGRSDVSSTAILTLILSCRALCNATSFATAIVIAVCWCMPVYVR